MKTWLAIEIEHGARTPSLREIEIAAEDRVSGEGWRVTKVRASDSDPYQRGYRAGKDAQDRDPSLATARAAIDKFGTPPPGEGTHPLQGHRDSMG